MLASASEHYERQQQITGRAVTAARRARWGSLPRLVAVVTMFRMAAARDAAGAVPVMLAEQGLDDTVVGLVVPSAIVATASDGRPIASLLDLTRSQQVSDYQFDRIVATQVQDAARQAASVATTAAPAAAGYVRMLNPPSCSRCAVLAGRKYRWNAGFLRHPGCDCRHIPAGEDTADDLTTDPESYFNSLPTAAQLKEQYPNLTVAQRRKEGLYSREDIFTVNGARAIEDGADVSKVVNARRGMSTAQVNQRGWRARGRLQRVNVYGRDVYTTTEAGTRRRRRGEVRLMPESIYEIADNRADAIRLLRQHGYLR